MSATQPPDPVAPDPGMAGDRVSAETIAAPRVRGQRRIKAEHVRDYGIVVFAIGLFIYFTIASPVFLTKNNLLNLVFQNATIGVAACAVTLTIIAGNFDLSLGSIFVLSEVLAAYAAVHMGVVWAFPVALLSGAAMGAINGLLVTKLRINAFLATLASALTFGGIAVGVTHGGLLITPTSSVFTFIGQQRVAGVQYPVIIFAVVAIVLQLVLAYTVFGRHLYGVGGNRDAARLSGIKVHRTVIITFVITGAACGLAGLIDASTTGFGVERHERPGRPAGAARNRRRGPRRHQHLRRRRLGLAHRPRRADPGHDHERLRPARRPGLLAERCPRHPDHRRGRDQLGCRPPLTA